ncbi:LysR substrate-binding domain-containing protein [Kribbella jejuensis]|nr:LysR substrate-binding domain-containing protein [Kribbella jejuensis]
MPVDLRLLRYVVAIADEGSFQAAALRLHIAQPPLSRQIRDLERELGVALFHRRPTRLTEPGRTFVDLARRLLSDAEQLLDRTRQAAAGELGTVRVGYTVSAAYDDMPAALSAMREHHPGVEVVGTELWGRDLEAALRAGDLDVGLGRFLPCPDGFQREVLRYEPYVVVLATDHPLARHRRTSLADLRGETFRFMPRALAPTYYDAVLAALHSTGETFAIWESPTPGLRSLRLREPDGGFTLLPKPVADRLADVRQLSLTEALPPCELQAVWSPPDAGPAAQVLISTVREALAA